ncbi:MAG: hypothetical protein A2014_12920 [Spirochaetes bacterium GWF1_49_6]|nr:MAG: hypothetical protein A2014_12920 [Spirochaetes bacterium GWF1_49_6]
MSAIDRLAASLGRRDEVPNQELAKELREKNDTAGIGEIAVHLFDKDKNIANDCIKTLYEIGYAAPALIAEYSDSYVKLLKSKNNRMVWGAMIALSTIAAIRADELYPHTNLFAELLNTGSVITVDGAVRVLAGIAAGKAEYARKIFPILFDLLKTTRPKSVPQYCESILPAVSPEFRDEFIRALRSRENDLSPTQSARVDKAIKKLG